MNDATSESKRRKRVCPHCGTEVPDDWVSSVCPECYRGLPPEDSPPETAAEQEEGMQGREQDEARAAPQEPSEGGEETAPRRESPEDLAFPEAAPKCPRCGASPLPQAAFCVQCGTKLTPPPRCPRCEAAIPPQAVFCVQCGTNLQTGEPAAPSWSAEERPAGGFSPGRFLVGVGLVVVILVAGRVLWKQVREFRQQEAAFQRPRVGGDPRVETPGPFPSPGTLEVPAETPLPPVHPPTEPGGIHPDLESVLRAANARGKLLLVDFYGAWCPWCIKMDQTLANPQVKKLLGARFHYFKLDVGRFDQHPGCLRQYGVTSIPYLLVFNPEGRVRASGVGYQTPTDFLAFLNRAVVKPVDFGNRKGWQVVRMDSQEVAREDGRGTNVLDGDGNSIWHTEWSARSPQPPHEIVIDLGQSRKVAGVRYLPRQGHPNGRIQEYEFFVSNSPENLGPPVAQGSFPNEGTEKRVRFKTSQQGRYIGLRALSEVNRQPWTSVAELGILSD